VSKIVINQMILVIKVLGTVPVARLNHI